jgi:uncharacterized protein (TIGR00369 family)
MAVTAMKLGEGGLAREVMEAVIRKTPFAVLVDAKITHYEPGRVDLTVPVNDQMKQHHGFVHGAVIGFVADSACAWAAASVAGDVVTSEYKLHLLAPAVGESILGRGYVVKESSRQVVCRADVFALKNGTERLVGTALATIAKMKA